MKEEEFWQEHRDVRSVDGFYGKRGKHRRKWKCGRRTGRTLRYCAVCQRTSVYGYLTLCEANPTIKYRRRHHNVEYSLNKRQRWLLVPPQPPQHNAPQHYCRQQQHPQQEAVRESAWERGLKKTKIRRDRLRIKGYADNHYPGWRTRGRKPPRVPKLRANRPTFLFKPELRYFSLPASEFEEFISLDRFPIQTRWDTKTRSLFSLPPILPEDRVDVFIVDNPHVLREGARNIGMVLLNEDLNRDRWDNSWSQPRFAPMKTSDWTVYVILSTCDPLNSDSMRRGTGRVGRCLETRSSQTLRNSNSMPNFDRYGPPRQHGFKQEFRKLGMKRFVSDDFESAIVY